MLHPPKHEHVTVMWKHGCICQKHSIEPHPECTECQSDIKLSHVECCPFFNYREGFERWDRFEKPLFTNLNWPDRNGVRKFFFSECFARTKICIMDVCNLL